MSRHYCRGCQCCLALLSQKLVPNRRCQTLIEWPEWPKDEMNSKHTVSTARVWLAQRQGMSTQSSCNSKKGYFEPYPSFCNSLHVPHRFLSWRLCNGVSDVDYLGTTLLQHHHEVVPFNMQVSVKRWWWVSMKLCIWMKLEICSGKSIIPQKLCCLTCFEALTSRLFGGVRNIHVST